MLLNNEWVNNEIKEEIKRHLETNEKENTVTKNLWDKENSPKRDLHSVPSLPQETRKISNKQSNLTLKVTRKRTTNKAQSE